MNCFKNLRMFVVILLLFPCSSLAGFEDYKAANLSEIAAVAVDTFNKTKSQLIKEIGNDPNITSQIENGRAVYMVKVQYTGKTRELSEDSKKILGSYPAFKADNIKPGDNVKMGIPPWAEMFKEEILVEDGKSTFWLPIQAQVLPFMHKELVEGDNVALYVAYVGINNQRPVFLVNEFQKITQADLEKDKIQELYKQGQSLIRSKEYDKASEVFNKILQANPGHYDALSNICLIMQLKKQNDAAVKCYDKVIIMNSGAYEAFYSKGIIFSEQKKYTDAIKEFDKAINIVSEMNATSSGKANMYYMRAASKLELNLKDAVVDLEKAREFNPDLISLEQIENVKKKLNIK